MSSIVGGIAYTIPPIRPWLASNTYVRAVWALTVDLTPRGVNSAAFGEFPRTPFRASDPILLVRRAVLATNSLFWNRGQTSHDDRHYTQPQPLPGCHLFKADRWR